MDKSHTWLEASILESTGVEPEEKDHPRDWERGGQRRRRTREESD